MALIVEYFSFFLVVFVLIAMVVFYREMDETGEIENENRGENIPAADKGQFVKYYDTEDASVTGPIHAGSEYGLEYTDIMQVSDNQFLLERMLPDEYADVTGPYTLEESTVHTRNPSFPLDKKNTEGFSIHGK